MLNLTKRKRTAAADAAHDQQAGGAYRLAVCARCGAAFAYPNARMPRTVCDDCKKAVRAARARRDKAANAYGRNEANRLARDNAALLKAQRERAAARTAALRRRDARCAAWYAANGGDVRAVTRADGTVVETRGRVCGTWPRPEPFTFARVMR